MFEMFKSRKLVCEPRW